MLKRDKKSAVLNLSSVVATQPFGSTPLYSSTKAFNDYLSRGTAHEYIDKIDIMSVRPGFVSTPLNFYREVGGDTITTEDCVTGTLQKLGYDRWTNGNWRHGIINYLVYMIPDTILQPPFMKMYKKRVEKLKQS